MRFVTQPYTALVLDTGAAAAYSERLPVGNVSRKYNKGSIVSDFVHGKSTEMLQTKSASFKVNK